MTEINSLISQLKNLADDLKSQIHNLDERIQDAHKRRDIITSAVVSREDFMSFMRADIQDKAQRFLRGMRPLIERLPKQYPALERGFRLPYLSGGSSAPVVMTEEAYYFYFGEIILERIGQAIVHDMDWSNGAMPVKERREIAAKIDAEIDDLRKQRKALADELIAAGLAA